MIGDFLGLGPMTFDASEIQPAAAVIMDHTRSGYKGKFLFEDCVLERLRDERLEMTRSKLAAVHQPVCAAKESFQRENLPLKAGER